jgi:hypothetical protein
MHDVLVAGAAVRAICKQRDLDTALAETLEANGIQTVSGDQLAELCRDISRAAEGKEWRAKQLELI